MRQYSYMYNCSSILDWTVQSGPVLDWTVWSGPAFSGTGPDYGPRLLDRTVRSFYRSPFSNNKKTGPRLSIHKAYGYGKSIWNFHMDIDRMDIWITYGHMEINLVSGYNTTFWAWASRYTSNQSGSRRVRASRPSWGVRASQYLLAGLRVLWCLPAGSGCKLPARYYNELWYLGSLVGADIAMPASWV